MMCPFNDTECGWYDEGRDGICSRRHLEECDLYAEYYEEEGNNYGNKDN